MSDSLSWIDDANYTRIMGIVGRSADVIAAARHDLEEHHGSADSQPSTDLLKGELSSRPATQRKVTSAQRRARLRQLLRNPNLDTLTTPSHEAVRNPHVHPRSTEQTEERIGTANSVKISKRQRSRLRRQSAPARLQHEENGELRKQEGPLNRNRGHLCEKTAVLKGLPNKFSSLLIGWTQRLDYLTNVVIGVLATALAISSFVRAGPTDPHLDALPLVAKVNESGDQPAIPMVSKASLHPARGFKILPGAFREPLPPFAGDVSGLLSLATPLPSAPGIIVLPYLGLPQALPEFPEDIAQLIMIASSPGPDGRDYLIRTLVFEASGETKIGKVAVAHVILNRKRSGRWGRKLADVVTSPWQFEPWMTRRNEIARLSRTDPRYLEAAEITDAVLAGDIPDPTAGATHFLNPVIVRERREGSLPLWADTDGQPIGRHVFYCPECEVTEPMPAGAVVAAKSSNVTPAASDRGRRPRVDQTIVAESQADVGTADTSPAVLRPAAEKLEARSEPKLTTHRRQTHLPRESPTHAWQRRNFVPHAFW
jgi:hypothetical protein